MCRFIDTRGAGLTMTDRLQLFLAPLPWRDARCVDVVGKFISMYSHNMNVDLMECINDSDYLKTLTQIEEKIALGLPPHAKGGVLENLETFHKILVYYLWMSFRNPVSFHCHEDVSGLKTRVEKALDWTLEGVSELDVSQQRQTKWEDIRAERDQGKQITYQSTRKVKVRKVSLKA
jgi:ATP-dependent RNA helicase SUPV3L1/SUV3